MCVLGQLEVRMYVLKVTAKKQPIEVVKSVITVDSEPASWTGMKGIG